MFWDNNKVKNVKKEKVTKSIRINDTETKVTFDKVFTGEIKGNREILDEQVINNMLNEMVSVLKANQTKYNAVPSEIVIKTNGEPASNDSSTEDSNQHDNILECYDPRYTLSQVILNKSVKDKINIAISATKHQAFLRDEWGLAEHFGSQRAIVLNFYGQPGTGKSMAAEAVASALGKKVYHINYSDLESKYVGETPKNIKSAFAKATQDDAVLIFDEADSFLGKRLTSVTQSADYGVNITRSVLLMELEQFSGVVIFTTNLIKNYDEAFKRRLLLSVLFEMPNKDAREDIWKLHIGEKLPLDDNVSPKVLAEKYENVSGADIKDMVFYASLYSLQNDQDSVDINAFDNAYDTLKERYEDKSKNLETRIIKSEEITEEQYLRATGGDDKDA